MSSENVTIFSAIFNSYLLAFAVLAICPPVRKFKFMTSLLFIFIRKGYYILKVL
jgi:hypothetical protein